MAKLQLQRIESTLAQLNGTKTDLTASAASQPPQAAPLSRSLQGYSFKIVASTASAASPPPKIIPPAHAGSLPNLPKFKPPSFSSHHHAANPALAMNLLKTLETKVAVWQTELQQILRQVQALYEEGPIIDGWLDTHAQAAAPVTPLRHAEVDRLMDYVQEICQAQPSTGMNESQAGYRLCGLDADGKLWSRPCPPEQLPHISLAIARYQKLRQLLARKQELENHLNTLAQALIPLQGHLQTLP